MNLLMLSILSWMTLWTPYELTLPSYKPRKSIGLKLVDEIEGDDYDFEDVEQEVVFLC